MTTRLYILRKTTNKHNLNRQTRLCDKICSKNGLTCILKYIIPCGLHQLTNIKIIVDIIHHRLTKFYRYVQKTCNFLLLSSLLLCYCRRKTISLKLKLTNSLILSLHVEQNLTPEIYYFGIEFGYVTILKYSGDLNKS